MGVETAHALAVRQRPPDGDGSEEDARWVGVVRDPPGWFRRRVDVHYPTLGLDEETRATLETRRRDLQMRGLCEEGAHNAAWRELDVADRYRDHVSSGEARAALTELAGHGNEVVLATDRRPGYRCHRDVLADLLADR